MTGGPDAHHDGQVKHADWRTTIDAGEFLAEAGPALRADPVENTVLLTIAHGARDAGATPAHASTLLGWHAGGPHPVGAFAHTPGLPVVLGPLPESAAISLAATLRHLGRALPGVNGAPATAERPQINAVVHQAYIDVDEQGTEAAAATAVGMRAMALRREPDPIPLTVDRPFLFAILDTSTGLPLFLGQVTRPAAKTT